VSRRVRRSRVWLSLALRPIYHSRWILLVLAAATALEGKLVAASALLAAAAALWVLRSRVGEAHGMRSAATDAALPRRWINLATVVFTVLLIGLGIAGVPWHFGVLVVAPLAFAFAYVAQRKRNRKA
jgi:hypothetical protein